MDEQIIDDDPGFPSLATQKDVRMVLSALEQLNIKMDKLAEARAARRTKTIQTRLRTMPRAIPQTIAGQFPMKAKVCLNCAIPRLPFGCVECKGFNLKKICTKSTVLPTVLCE
ncbi:hypothetical protein L3Y34_000573 [Caenorhabditis briggsae]|uniref:Uncharacterized protein n=1 Tax=Caenorhabditis briggsae TaxID=6238 RepID=A0AAE9D9R2_CAEBR|nr:hypothetical protein L3Y34_000573 [Caenorhabditis briggsae]